MSDDELEKLAAEMKNIHPSKLSRQRGMDAAMAAFDMEFVQDDIVQTQAVEEKISGTSQGLAASPRPTGQTTQAARRTARVQTLGRDAMSKLSEIFSFKPKTAMMMGSCAVALFATSLYFPNTTFENLPAKPAPENIAVEIDAVEVTGKKAEATPPAEQEAVSEDQIAELPSAPAPEPTPLMAPKAPAADKALSADDKAAKAQGGITSINSLLNKVRTDDAQAKSENLAREAEFRKRRNQAAGALVNSAPGRLSAQGAVRPSIRLGDSGLDNPLTRTPQPDGYIFEEVPAQYKTETKTIVTKEASTELVTIPPTYETVTETVVVIPESKELVVIPPAYQWVDGDVEGSSIEYDTQPAEYETVQEPVVVQEASTELVTIPSTYNADGTIATPAHTQERVIPSVTKMETRRVLKTPARTVERVVPYEKRNGRTRVPVKPATVSEKAVPAVTKQVTRRVIKTPASTQERITPAGARKKVAVRTVVSPERFYLRGEDGKIIREFESRDAFEKYKSNLVTLVEEKPVSTFSVDVDTASYSFLRASINRGQLPPRNSIRLEEMINYFPYDYESPRSADEPFKANVTVTPTPWNADTKLMHIGIKGYVPPADEKPQSNIVFLIDTSGSMNNANKLPLLINSFKLLLGTLDAEDTVSIVTYAGRAGTVLEPTAASEKQEIYAALNRLSAGGSTAGAAGLELAYNKAQESFVEDGINRVILATDGDFNVGFSSPDEMKSYIEDKRETGIFLSVLGFGMGNYNDHLMQSLAQNGNGVAAYIDNLAEANKVLANEAGSALITIAKDVKIQVEFNPETISEYRLIGYETRALKRQDFNNDKVDAGEIGAGHSVTAIYEMTPVGSPAQSTDPLRYVTDRLKPTTGSDEFAFVKIRHKLPNADTSTLQTFPIGPKQESSMKRASDDARFAMAVAAVGQKLRGDTPLDDFSYEDAIKLASGAKGKDENGYRSEFIQLVRLMESLKE